MSPLLPSDWESESNHVPVIAIGPPSSRQNTETVLKDFTSKTLDLDVPTFPHLLTNRYYTTLLNFEIFHQFDDVLKAGKTSSQALVFSVDLDPASIPMLRDILSVLASTSNTYEVAIVLLLLPESVVDGQDALKEEFEEACTENGFELIEVLLGGGKGADRDERGEVKGMKRVEEALSACRWDKMLMKSQQGKGKVQVRPDTEVHSSEDEQDEDSERSIHPKLQFTSTDPDGFADDFSDFVPAPLPSSSQTLSLHKSKSFLDDDDFGNFVATSHPSTSTTDLGIFPTDSEIKEAHDMIFNKRSGHDPFFDDDDPDDIASLAAYGQLHDDEEEDGVHDFDLANVIENLRNLKEVASGIEDEEERKRFAEKVALGFQKHFEA